MNLADLRAAFAGRLHTHPSEMAPFLTDWRKAYKSTAIAVAHDGGSHAVDSEAAAGACGITAAKSGTPPGP